MSSSDHTFLFSFPGAKLPSSARTVHIRRLYDILQLAISRHDIPRAKQAWCILARCKEIHWTAMWRTAIHLLGERHNSFSENLERLDLLNAMMRQHPDEQESILKELVFRNILAGRHRQALDELELYLPSLPFQENPVLHVYAGLLSIFLSQASEEEEGVTNKAMLRDAQAHLERACSLDPQDPVAAAFLSKMPEMLSSKVVEVEDQSEHGDLDLDDDGERRKRSRA